MSADSPQFGVHQGDPSEQAPSGENRTIQFLELAYDQALRRYLEGDRATLVSSIQHQNIEEWEWGGSVRELGQSGGSWEDFQLKNGATILVDGSYVGLAFGFKPNPRSRQYYQPRFQFGSVHATDFKPHDYYNNRLQEAARLLAEGQPVTLEPIQRGGFQPTRARDLAEVVSLRHNDYSGALYIDSADNLTVQSRSLDFSDRYHASSDLSNKARSGRLGQGDVETVLTLIQRITGVQFKA